MRKAWFACLLLLALLSMPAVSRATTSDAPRDLGWMVDHAHAIFHGTCETLLAYWDDSTQMIWTDMTFRVHTYLKGNLGPRVTMTELGGVLPEWNLEMHVSTLPQLRGGEEVILFLWTDSHGRHRMLGASHERYDVELDPATGRKLVRGVPLDVFLRRITSHIEGLRQE